jgi:hypothetical protein
MSPQTVTGHLTGCTFDSSIRISRVYDRKNVSSVVVIKNFVAVLCHKGALRLLPLTACIGLAALSTSQFRAPFFGFLFQLRFVMWRKPTGGCAPGVVPIAIAIVTAIVT